MPSLHKCSEQSRRHNKGCLECFDYWAFMTAARGQVLSTLLAVVMQKSIDVILVSIRANLLLFTCILCLIILKLINYIKLCRFHQSKLFFLEKIIQIIFSGAIHIIHVIIWSWINSICSILSILLNSGSLGVILSDIFRQHRNAFL